MSSAFQRMYVFLWTLGIIQGLIFYLLLYTWIKLCRQAHHSGPYRSDRCFTALSWFDWSASYPSPLSKAKNSNCHAMTLLHLLTSSWTVFRTCCCIHSPKIWSLIFYELGRWSKLSENMIIARDFPFVVCVTTLNGIPKCYDTLTLVRPGSASCNQSATLCSPRCQNHH